MKNAEIELLLNPMVGKSYTLDNIVQKFEGFSINGTKVVMSFTDTVMPVKFEDLEMFIAQIITGQQNKPAVQAAAAGNAGLTIIERSGGSLMDVILDNINRVKSDPAYIPQAEAVNNQLKTFIDLAKAEIEMKKTLLLISKIN